MDIKVIQSQLLALARIGITGDQALELIKADMQVEATKKLARAIEGHGKSVEKLRFK